ncbi:hypothetical protein AAC387_Pa10g0600 [Persea americana]
MGLPWIGETVQFYQAQVKNRLYHEFVLPRLAKHGSIFKTRLMGEPTVVVIGAEANRFFLSNEFKFVISSWPTASVELMGKDSIMGKGPELHHWLRGAFASCLNWAALEALAPKVCGLVTAHLDTSWRGRDSVHLFHSAKLLAFSIVCECLLGIKAEKGLVETFERVLGGVFAVAVEVPGSKFWKAKRARKEIGKVLRGVVRERKEEMERGLREEEEVMLLSRLVLGLVRGEVSEEEVVDNVVLLIFAAHDTTALAISMIFRMLGNHPHCYDRLLQEHVEINKAKRDGESLTWEDVQKMKYTWQVARESMRLFPPIFGSFRKAIVDIDYKGFTIPKGWKVLWTMYGTHYDPHYFPQPEIFDPSRFEKPMPPYVFIPFGGGQRSCAGYQLAKLNILIFIHYIVTRFEWSLLDPHEPIVVDPLPFPSKGMPIKIYPKLL